jgi:hypothetical protein
MLKSAVEGFEEIKRKAAERKERLRRNDWRVNNERLEWKGDDYYRGLRRRFEVELRGWE